MKRFLLIISLLIFSIPIYCQNSNSVNISKTNLDVWDIQLSADIPDAVSAEFDGTYFYVASNFSNLIKQYDAFGNFIGTFSIPGVSVYNDLTFDGFYMYTGNGSTTIYQMDFSTQTLNGTISSPVNVRYIAYDENNDGFWVGSWTDPNITLISRTGVLISTYNTGLNFISGSAYDNFNPGGPYLWLFDRGNVIPGPQLIRQFHIPSGTFTGITHDVLSDIGTAQPNAAAGGLFSTSNFFPFTYSLGGVLIGNPSILFLYDVTNPVPVELSFFKAAESEGNVILSWQTATEKNNSGFEVERNSGQGFKAIGFVDGAGTTTEIHNYSFIDLNIPSGNYKYRLNQIDYNGEFNYSNEISLNIEAPEKYSLWQNYPNPFNPTTTIKYEIPLSVISTGGKNLVSIKIFDVLGREIAVLVNEPEMPGLYEVEFSAGEDLPSGIYICTLRIKNYCKTRKMLLLK